MSKIENTLFPVDGWDLEVLKRAEDRLDCNLDDDITKIGDDSFIEYGKLYGFIDSLIYEIDRLLEENDNLENRLWNGDSEDER
jgi:hypothetical protein